MDYRRMHQLNIRVVRIFNTYGPGMHPFDGRVVSNFICQALAGSDITIYGDGRQSRSFCYRDDLIEGMIRMMNAPGRFRRAGQPWQPGRVHDQRAGRTGVGIDRLEKQARLPPVAGRRSHAASARYYAGAQPDSAGSRLVALRDGLQKTIAWFRSIDISRYRAPTPAH